MAVGTVIIVFCLVPCMKAANMSGLILEGQYSRIWEFPHSVYVYIEMGLNKDLGTCGASILNQAILLTAAHCVNAIDYPTIFVYAGSVKEETDPRRTIINYTVHENFDWSLKNDIALLLLGTMLEFGKNIRRVILMPDPPYDQIGYVAGWGQVKAGKTGSVYLKHISQIVYKRKQCGDIGLNNLPDGTICGEHRKKKGNPTEGDGGSALVVHDSQIQIGIVSYVSSTITVYTDTGHFYDWIKKNAEILFCTGN